MSEKCSIESTLKCSYDTSSNITYPPTALDSSLEVVSKTDESNESTRLSYLAHIGDNTSDSVYKGYSQEQSLGNWNKWLEIHKQQQKDLQQKLGRPPKCMLMNSNMDTLYVNQEKILINEASEYKICDKYRGHPNFWRVDNPLNESGRFYEPYQNLQQKYDRSNPCPGPPVLEYVGVPRGILELKGIGGKSCFPTREDNWENSSSVQKKKEDLKTNLQVIQHHKPEVAELMIVGTASQRFHSQSKKELIKTINERLLNDSNGQQNVETAFVSDNEPQLIETPPILKIGDTFVKADNELTSWKVYFVKCHVHEQYESHLDIKNVGDISVRYSWEMISPHWLNHIFPIKQYHRVRPRFYFKQNDDVILPETEKQLSFWFKSETPGVFTESWQLRTDPVLNDNPIIIELQAIAIEEDDPRELKAIDDHIKSRTNYTIASKTLHEILGKSRPKKLEELPYDEKFFEEKIFMYNNPSLFYDSSCVLKLKILHSTLSVEPWDFSVANLRCKLSSMALNQDVKEEIKLFITNVYQLMQPNNSVSLLTEKHKTVNEMLCAFVNKMDFEAQAWKQFYRLQPLIANKRPSKIIRSTEYSLTTIPEVQQTKKLDKPLSKKRSKQERKLTTKTDSGSNSETDTSDMKQSFLSVGGVVEDLNNKQQYLERLYIVTYHHLSSTVDAISAALDSFAAEENKTVLSTLKGKGVFKL